MPLSAFSPAEAFGQSSFTLPGILNQASAGAEPH